MTTPVPPTQQAAAAPSKWGTTTVQDLWSLSDAGGVSAGAIFCALDQCVRSDAESVSDLD